MVIMPNHIHGIVVINRVGAWPCVRPPIDDNANDRVETSPTPTDCGMVRKTVGDDWKWIC